MANKILADLGLSPLSKFLLVYWFSLGFIVLDQIGTLSEVPVHLAEMGLATAVTAVVIAALILYGAYLLYNKQKRGALIAIAVNVAAVASWVFLVQPGEIPPVAVAIYLGTFIVMVAGPVLLFPDEYS